MQRAWLGVGSPEQVLSKLPALSQGLCGVDFSLPLMLSTVLGCRPVSLPLGGSHSWLERSGWGKGEGSLDAWSKTNAAKPNCALL